MSVLVFELKENHIKLLKHLRWSINGKFIASTENADEDPAPFGANNLYEGINLIINGRQPNVDPLEVEEIEVYSDEAKAEMDKLYSELPMALDIILYNGHFELGTYRTKFHDRQWKKIN